MSSAISYRFEVALSFPGEYRNRVEHIADILAANLGREHVLYDAWYREEFARANLDVYLPDIYRKQSRLLVFFFCKEYADKEWTGLEWRAGRDLLKQKQDERLMFLRFDNADIPGLYSGDGYIDIAKLPDDVVAADILKRLNHLAPAPRASIETAVQALRATIEPTIRERCGRVRVLSMERAVDLGSVYTNVLMLAKRPTNQLKTRDELVRDAQRDEFDRFGLSSGRTPRIEGARAFDTERRIIIYGKPGSGKTTFLKHLAMECSTGSFRAALVPVFITLRDYADIPTRPSLCQYVEEQWQMNLNSRTVLNHGLALVLLDGLDEVRNRDFTRVRQGIEEFAREFPLNTIALTCRIAAREYTFESFTEVEMADFDEKQITWFSSRWFTAHNELRKAESFVEKLKSNPPVWELASNPLLLTLLCLVFQDRNDFDGTRADLYKQALDILLYRWDARRDLERDFPSGVSKAELEPLLTEIAYTRFMANEYFFDQSSLHEQIDHFLRKRAFSSTR